MNIVEEELSGGLREPYCRLTGGFRCLTSELQDDNTARASASRRILKVLQLTLVTS